MLIAQQVYDTPSVRIGRSPDISRCFLKEAEAKSPLVENHWLQDTSERHKGEETAPMSEDHKTLRGETIWVKRKVCTGPWYKPDPGVTNNGEGVNPIIKSSLPLHAKSLQLRPTLWPQGVQPARLLYPWDSSGKNTGMGCHVLLHLSLQ